MYSEIYLIIFTEGTCTLISGYHKSHVQGVCDINYRTGMVTFIKDATYVLKAILLSLSLKVVKADMIKIVSCLDKVATMRVLPHCAYNSCISIACIRSSWRHAVVAHPQRL